METKSSLLLLICLLIGFYLKLNWLVALLVVFLFFVVLGSMTGKEKRVAVPKGGHEEIIYPVIYEDVGESPWLYHPKTTIDLIPDWRPSTQWSKAADGMASIFNVAATLITGRKPKKNKTEED